MSMQSILKGNFSTDDAGYSCGNELNLDLLHTIHKNYYEVYHKLKCKSRNYKTSSRKYKKIFLQPGVRQSFLKKISEHTLKDKSNCIRIKK